MADLVQVQLRCQLKTPLRLQLNETSKAAAAAFPAAGRKVDFRFHENFWWWPFNHVNFLVLFSVRFKLALAWN